MTERLSPEQLRRIVRQTEAAPPRAALRMAWAIDATTGRPVARWVAVEDWSEPARH